MKHQKSLVLSIHSFLEHCPRNLAIPTRFLDPISQLYALVLLILLRASKSAESEDMFLRAFEHENIIYNGAVFDIPCLIDLAVLYGNNFPDTVSTIFRSVFSVGGKFSNDAVSVICRVTIAFEQAEKNVLQWQFDEKHKFTSYNADATDIVAKTIDYITDAGRSLGIFLTFLGPIDPSIAELCIQKNIVSSLANFYNTTIVTIRDHILRSMTWTTKEKTALLNKLAIAAAALVKTVRVGLVEPGLVHRIMQMTFDSPDASCNLSLMGATNTLIGVMVDMLNYPDFATAYARLYSVEDDIILIRENSSSANLDRDQLEYLRGAFSLLIEELLGKHANSDGAKEAIPPPVEEMLRDRADEQPQPGCSRSPEFRAVKTVLPTTDNDLIERCLEHYNNDSQSVITALLDGSVPLSVSNPDYAEPVTQYKPGELWQGKRQNNATMQPLSKEERERINQLAVSVWDDDDNNWEDGSDAGNEAKDMGGFFGKLQADLTYDDEYDDTYDVEVGAKLEPVDEEVENAELGDTFDQTEKPYCRASPAQGEPRADRGKHRYRQEHFDQRQRQNVLPIENPEDVRLRRQQTAANRAMRYSRNRGIERLEAPSQPTPPKIETKSPSRVFNEAPGSGRGTPTKAGSSTQREQGGYRFDRARSHLNNRGGGRGRASGRGRGDTYAYRLKERFGTYDR
ncbi:Activating signal cointegrator 1 complex subunit 2 [Taenia crassiceps]|uniref:Activating signal cointegrator 1 complex subunit 2 n=1 Tax=Taenia crassiceps TaxID=6207 RepID=A0ABR4QBW0_9CEST